MFYSVEECLSHKPGEKDNKQFLFDYQKKTLDTFLQSGFLSKEQYDKDLNTLIKSMGMEEYTLQTTQVD